MGRSPITQDGKLVGAVTHVLVNGSTREYGIFIENDARYCRIKIKHTPKKVWTFVD